MTPAWYVLPDGGYKRLSETEDLISDLRSTFEDVRDTLRALGDVSSNCRAAQEESRLLVEMSKRQRRLRKSRLRLVQVRA